MPVSSDVSIAQRKVLLFEITRRLQLNPEEKVEDVCEAMKISKSTYYRWIHDDPETVDTFRQMIIDLSKEELMSILAVRELLLNRLIMDGINPMTSTGDRLQLIKYLDERTEKLASQNRATGDNSAREFLSGPTLVSANSRFSNTVNISPQSDGSVNIKVSRESDVVDSILKEITSHDQPEIAPVSQTHQPEVVDASNPAVQKFLLSLESQIEEEHAKRLPQQ